MAFRLSGLSFFDMLGLDEQIDDAIEAAMADVPLSVTGDPNGVVSGDANDVVVDRGTGGIYKNTNGADAWAKLTHSENLIVASAHQDTDLGIGVDHTELQFPVLIGGVYAVEFGLYLAGEDTSADPAIRFAVTAGTMDGWGHSTNFNASGAGGVVSNLTAASATSPTMPTGSTTDAPMTIPLFNRGVHVFRQNTSSATFKLQFGVNSVAAGRSVRVMAGSWLKWKRLV